eukprot:COSAG01_NODE_49380_length_372_cov_2.743590_1_plen_48_part_01
MYCTVPDLFSSLLYLTFYSDGPLGEELAARVARKRHVLNEDSLARRDG